MPSKCLVNKAEQADELGMTNSFKLMSVFLAFSPN